MTTQEGGLCPRLPHPSDHDRALPSLGHPVLPSSRTNRRQNADLHFLTRINRMQRRSHQDLSRTQPPCGLHLSTPCAHLAPHLPAQLVSTTTSSPPPLPQYQFLPPSHPSLRR